MPTSINTIQKRLQSGFESSTGKTPEFNAFARQFKSAIKAELESAGAELVSFSVNHFDCSGFYAVGDAFGYFSLGDVRSMVCGNQLMFRTAKHTKDYTGGSNNWVDITPGLGVKMARLLRS
jgi:hypothetical protein